MFRLELDMTPAELDAMYREQLEEMDRHTLDAFKRVLARALQIQRAKMRPDGGYDDQTGQLRSSTGGLIYRDGLILHEDFQLSPYGTDKTPGIDAGRELALREVKLSRSSGDSAGWGITLVSGMEYASWVQNAHGKSVVEDAFLEVAKSLDQAFREIDV
ncbi:hypothetical protein M8998_07255 [Sphingobacterium sp. lm-10]|uniref:hypothetical protein n=1 Tax=Sphingobacterium sp. lm-10 TaxID=2944904 RepID=UPI00201FD373|nr:hypothetical protein [Sphingobacterium sp. lm-10]MCL7987731.1 hypothetical protein [Sphingobacterium sp. lm-10]